MNCQKSHYVFLNHCLEKCALLLSHSFKQKMFHCSKGIFNFMISQRDLFKKGVLNYICYVL